MTRTLRDVGIERIVEVNSATTAALRAFHEYQEAYERLLQAVALTDALGPFNDPEVDRIAAAQSHTVHAVSAISRPIDETLTALRDHASLAVAEWAVDAATSR